MIDFKKWLIEEILAFLKDTTIFSYSIHIHINQKSELHNVSLLI